jgi:hypothetical protein
MAGSKGSGCPYLKESKGCLHALKYGLQLDEEQMERVREIQSAFLEESAGLKKSIWDTATELDKLYRSPEASGEEIFAKGSSLAGLKNKMDEMAIGFRLKIREELTEEQLGQIPEGCWHGLLAYGHGGDYHHGGGCPYKSTHKDVST